MGEINISWKLVQKKTDELTKKLQTELNGSVMKRYENLEGSLQQTCGEGIDAVRECLLEEKKTLTEINVFMNVLLSFIQESADAFEDVDNGYEEVYRNFV